MLQVVQVRLAHIGVGDRLARGRRVDHRRRHPPEPARLLGTETHQVDELRVVRVDQQRRVGQVAAQHRRLPVPPSRRQKRPLDPLRLLRRQVSTRRDDPTRMPTVTEEPGTELACSGRRADRRTGTHHRRLSERSARLRERTGHMPHVAMRPQLLPVPIDQHRRHTLDHPAITDDLRVDHLERRRPPTRTRRRHVRERVTVRQHRRNQLVQPHVLLHQVARTPNHPRGRRHRHPCRTHRPHRIHRQGRHRSRQRVNTRRRRRMSQRRRRRHRNRAVRHHIAPQLRVPRQVDRGTLLAAPRTSQHQGSSFW